MLCFDFAELSFILVKFQGKLGHFTEGTVDLQKIIMAREFLTREFPCPVYGTPRLFNRIYRDHPFSNENIRRLSDALKDPSKRSAPKHLRTLSQEDMHTRAEKFIEIPELENWLESGYDYGSILREKFQVKCAENGNTYSVELFIEIMRVFVQKRKQGKDVTEHIAQITVSDIVDYSLSED